MEKAFYIGNDGKQTGCHVSVVYKKFIVSFIFLFCMGHYMGLLYRPIIYSWDTIISHI